VADADIKMLLADLSNELVDAKLAAANLKSELADCKSELTDLKEKSAQTQSAKPEHFDGGYQFAEEDGLFCTGCFDSKRQKMRLASSKQHFDDAFGKWNCPVCKQYFA
jgi:hypothetical protein